MCLYKMKKMGCIQGEYLTKSILRKIRSNSCMNVMMPVHVRGELVGIHWFQIDILAKVTSGSGDLFQDPLIIGATGRPYTVLYFCFNMAAKCPLLKQQTKIKLNIYTYTFLEMKTGELYRFTSSGKERWTNPLPYPLFQNPCCC